MNKNLISILGGLGAMIGWGSSDFLANSASDKVGHKRAFFWSQASGLILLGIVSVFFSSGPSSFSPQILLLSTVAGIAYSLGYLFFYNGFEVGNVSVVSAVINLQNIFVISISYFIFGQSLTSMQIPALLLLIFGVALVSINFRGLKSGGISLVRGVKETLIATIMFGVFFWPLNEYIVERADWISAIFLIKLISLLFVLLMAKITSKSLVIPKPSKGLVRLLISVGFLEAVGVISMSYGVALGDAIIVSPISSALTIVTISLAVIFLKEKMSKIQWLGIALTMIGIFMMGY